LYGPADCAFQWLTDCSIDFDWLQVHINKEQELQYHRDKGQVFEMQGQYFKEEEQKNGKEQSRVVISDQF